MVRLVKIPAVSGGGRARLTQAGGGGEGVWPARLKWGRGAEFDSPPGYFSLKIPPYSFMHLSTYNRIEGRFRFMSRRFPMTGSGFGPGMAENGLISDDCSDFRPL